MNRLHRIVRTIQLNSKEGTNMEQETKKYHVRRVGSVTFGITLLCYGILFLVHVFVPTLKYQYIFRCWPVVFILLGCEVLVENHKSKTEDCKVVYDFAAVIMLAVMLLFAMIMAVMDFDFTYGPFIRW